MFSREKRIAAIPVRTFFGMGELTVTIKKTFVSFQYSDADYSGSGGAVEGVSLQHRGFVTFQIVSHRRKISGILKNSEKNRRKSIAAASCRNHVGRRLSLQGVGHLYLKSVLNIFCSSRVT